MKANYILRQDQKQREEYLANINTLIQSINKTAKSETTIKQMLKEIKQFIEKDHQELFSQLQ